MLNSQGRSSSFHRTRRNPWCRSRPRPARRWSRPALPGRAAAIARRSSLSTCPSWWTLLHSCRRFCKIWLLLKWYVCRTIKERPESRFELTFESLDIRILNKELCTKLAEFGKLDLPRAVLVDLLQDRLQLLSTWSEAHRSENLVEVICWEERLLLRVEEVKAIFQALDLIVGQVCGFIDLLKVNAFVGVDFVSHGDWRQDVTAMSMFLGRGAGHH